MNSSILIVLIIAAVVLVAIVAFFVMRGRGASAKRDQAERIREEEAQREQDLRRREAEAAEADAAARRAAAEADEQSAHAAKLSAEADEQAARARQMADDARVRATEAEGVRSEHTERMREADRLDPDVPTDKEGNRIDAPAAAGAASGAATHDGAGERHDEHGATGDRDHDGVPNAVDPNDAPAGDGPVDRDGDGIDDREEAHWDRQTREREEQRREHDGV